MSLEPIQQILSHLRQAKHILLTTKANPSGDSIAAALAFYLLLKKQGKTASVVIDNAALQLANAFDFLPGYKNIATALANSGKITVEFDLQGNSIRGLTYNQADGKLLINILPADKNLLLGHPSIRAHTYPYDLIVAVDTPDLESLGRLYDEHAEFFYAAPIINIDHQADNEHFGELNLVELTAVATTEIIFDLLEVWQKNLLSADIATCLLTGIISESKSFQTPNITPRSLAIASELMAAGGRRELIIEKLYGNKSVSVLQLWGRALSSLRTDPEAGLVWSIIKQSDFSDTNTNERDVRALVEDLLTHAPGAKVLILAYPTETGSQAIVHTHRPTFDLRQILSPLNPHGSRRLVECALDQSDAAQAVEIVKQTLAERAPREEALPKF